MSWTITGRNYGNCSCKMNCRCVFGPTEPDQGWCSGVEMYAIESGEADGTDLSGARLALLMDLPGDFFGGIEKARLWFDDATTNEAQRHALEEIFQGKRGGFWVGLQDAISQWLPSKVARIEITDTANGTKVSIAGVGEAGLTGLTTPDGKPTQIANAPVPAALGMTVMEVADGAGGRWHDPDMREWESLGWGARAPIAWSS